MKNSSNLIGDLLKLWGLHNRGVLMNKSLKCDLVAGFSVFLLALPLCLGIAIASCVPPIAGIFTAIVGGMVASVCGSSSLTIKGPAAGMIVIVLGAVQELGQGDLFLGYKLALAVGVVAALLQIGIALMRKAVIAEVMPPSVIHGMLAAIGVIIITKQAYVLCGVAPVASKTHELLFYFPSHVFNLNPLLFAIGLFAFAIAVFWPKITRLAFIPASIVILLSVIPLSLYFALDPKYLINLPINFSEGIQFPDFSQIFSPVSIKYIIMFTVVGSIESLLTVCAVDSMQNSSSDLNKDLRATGIANLVSACIGGIPMISEIVRSKANIDYGAKTAKSNFFHGLFLLIAVIVFPSVMNLIPLSALAALLIFVGLRLASPKEFIYAYQLGRDQFCIFMTTFIVTLVTDLLVGVLAGVFVELVVLWFRTHSFRRLFYPVLTVEEGQGYVTLSVDGPLTFVGYMRFKNELEKLVLKHKKVVVSIHAVTFMDHTVQKKIRTLAESRNEVEISIEQNQQLVQLYNHQQ